MGIQGFKECLQGTKVNLSDLIKNRMSGAPALRIGVDLSVYAHKGIKARDIKEIYAMDFNAKPPMDISGYAWAMLDDFLSAMEALASKCPIDIYLIFDAHQNPRKMETSEERKALTKKAAEDLESYISSRDAYNEKKMIDLLCKTVYPDNSFFAACYD